MKNKNNYAKQSMPYVILLLVIVGSLVFFRLSQYEVHDLSYDKFMTELQNGEVKKIEITPKNIRIRKKILDSSKRYKAKK